jgi:photosystem II stability/assembly factor-like uncharacterized protein
VLVSQDGGHHWDKQLINGLGKPKYVELSAMSCTGRDDHAVCAVVGSESIVKNDVWTGYKPVIARSTHNGRHWAATSVPALGDIALLRDVSCTGVGEDARCVAIGSDWTSSSILVSIDAGKTWSTKSLPALPVDSYFNAKSVSCTGSGSTAVCAFTGGSQFDSMGHGFPMMLVSGDGGETWAIKSVIDAMDYVNYGVKLNNVHCSGNGESAICAAVGARELLDDTDESRTLEPESVSLIIMSTDGGQTWSTKSITDLSLSDDSFLNSVTCTPGDMSTTCIAVGNSDDKPILAISGDTGNTWALSQTPLDSQSYGELSGAAAAH